MVIDSHQKSLLMAKAALDKHAEDVIVMDVRGLSGVTDYFIVATAHSRPQVLAIVEEIDTALKPHRERVRHIEGVGHDGPRGRDPLESFSWVLMDCGDVVVHVFHDASRQFYQLERLWGDAPRVAVA